MAALAIRGMMAVKAKIFVVLKSGRFPGAGGMARAAILMNLAMQGIIRPVCQVALGTLALQGKHEAIMVEFSRFPTGDGVAVRAIFSHPGVELVLGFAV